MRIDDSQTLSDNAVAVNTLDQLSTSQNLCFPHNIRCSRGAPHIAVQSPIRPALYFVMQGCCNDWTCPRCGQIRARHEYGRIVQGCRTLSEQGKELYFITITTRGGGLSKQDAMAGYLKWTNHLLTTLRQSANRHGQDWHYAQVTEYQKRKHPHSHILTTYVPHDAYIGHKKKWHTKNDGRRGYEWIECILSDYMLKSVQAAGLGKIYDISSVRDAEAASRYVSKYLFKDMMSAVWPDGWRRVRYSHSFPKLPEQDSGGFPLLSDEDWQKLARLATVVKPENEIVFQDVNYFMRGSDVLIDTINIERK